MAQCPRSALGDWFLCLFTYSVISFCIIVFSSHLPRSQSACSHVSVWVRVDANTFLHLYFFICHSAAGRCFLRRALLPSRYPCTTLHLFLFSARSLLPPSLVTRSVVLPLHHSLSHTPDTPTRTSDTATDPRPPTPQHRLDIPEPSHSATRSHLHCTHVITLASSSYAPTISTVPVPVCVFSALLWCTTSHIIIGIGFSLRCRE